MQVKRKMTMGIHLLSALGCLLVASAQAQAPAGPPPGGAMGPGGAQQEEANPPVIDSVSYSGNTKISSAALAKDSAVKPGMKVTRALVGGEIERIVAVYKKAGYDLSVSPDIQHPADGHVTVTFKIDENGKGGNGGPAAGGPPGGAPPSAPPQGK